MMKMYLKQSGEDTLQKFINESDMYFNKIKQLRVQEIRVEKKAS